jgi:beta-galactosidase
LAAAIFQIAPAGDDPWAGVRVARQGERPVLTVGGRAVPPFAYMSYLGREEWYREAAGAGIHLHCIPAYLGDRGINPRSGIGPFRRPVWTGEGAYDFASIAEDFDALLRADPKALAIVRLHMDAPAWWEERHPEGCCQLADGTTFRQSFTSPLWRRDASAALEALIAWLRQSPYARHLAGIHVAAGHTEEWFYHFREHFEDLNPSRTQAFRAWLREAYGGDEERLRAAWGDPGLSFDTADPADISGRERGEVWRDADTSRPVVDTFRFHAAAMADNVAHFCGVVKRAGGGGLLAGAFYGYHNFVNDPRLGHFALGRLLACPDLDYLSSPNVYNRVMGEDWPPMAAVGSVALHGKLWLAENDTRTSVTTLLRDQAPDICPPDWYDGGVWLGPDSLDDSVALLRKNTARMLAGGYGGWWFDMWGGWFNDPALMAVLRRTQELGAEDLARPVGGMEPQIAVFADEELAFHDASFGTLAEGIFSNRYPLGKTGAPYALYLLSDLERVPPESHRVFWLLGPTRLDAAAEAVLDEVSRQGVTVVWTRPGGTEVRPPGGSARFLEGKRLWLPGELRGLWREVGVRLYVDTDDVLSAGNGWVGLHTLEGGPRVISLPFVADVSDAFAGGLIAQAADRVEITLPPRSTTLLRVVPAEGL